MLNKNFKLANFDKVKDMEIICGDYILKYEDNVHYLIYTCFSNTRRDIYTFIGNKLLELAGISTFGVKLGLLNNKLYIAYSEEALCNPLELNIPIKKRIEYLKYYDINIVSYGLIHLVELILGNKHFHLPESIQTDYNNNVKHTIFGLEYFDYNLSKVEMKDYLNDKTKLKQFIYNDFKNRNCKYGRYNMYNIIEEDLKTTKYFKESLELLLNNLTYQKIEYLLNFILEDCIEREFLKQSLYIKLDILRDLNNKTN